MPRFDKSRVASCCMIVILVAVFYLMDCIAACHNTLNCRGLGAVSMLDPFS